jgi:arginine:ornithine antiporter/lysine permease
MPSRDALAAPSGIPIVKRSEERGFSLPILTAMVVGSMVGGGIFSLPQTQGSVAGAQGALIAWAITGGGMLCLAFVFQILAERKPDLDAGIFAYAKAGFGDYLGFLSALGYWTMACLGNVTFCILIFSTLGGVFPVFGDGNTLTAILLASLGVWTVHFLILRGIRQAALINTIATAAKIVPIVVFITICAFAFDRELFAVNFDGGPGLSEISLAEQVRRTMLVTVFVFVGLEGASVYSRYAQRRSDVGLATLIGFIGVLCLLVLVSTLSYGILPRGELAELHNPSMAGVLRDIVGPWGGMLIGTGLIISVLGAYLSWSLLTAEVLFSAARTGTMPAFLAIRNRRKVPSAALWMTSLLTQIFLVLSCFSKEAFILAVDLTSVMVLLPYLLVAAYLAKLSWKGTDRTAGARGRGELVLAVIATAYVLTMMYAAGPVFIFLSLCIYVPGTILFVMARHERAMPIFSIAELLLFAAAVFGAVAGAAALTTGRLAI